MQARKANKNTAGASQITRQNPTSSVHGYTSNAGCGFLAIAVISLSKRRVRCGLAISSADGRLAALELINKAAAAGKADEADGDGSNAAPEEEEEEEEEEEDDAVAEALVARVAASLSRSSSERKISASGAKLGSKTTREREDNKISF